MKSLHAEWLYNKKGAATNRPSNDRSLGTVLLGHLVSIVLELLPQLSQLHVLVPLLGDLFMAIKTLLAGVFGELLSCGAVA